MRFVHFFLLFLTLSASFSGAFAAADSDTENPIRVLVVTGGHPYDVPAFHGMLDSLPGVKCAYRQFPEAWDSMKPELAEEFDVLLFYDMWQKPLTDQQKADFKALFASGIGIYALHHDLCAHVHWDEYYDMVGARIFYGKSVFRGKEYPGSTFRNGRDLPIQIADPAHPVTKGMSDFVIHDEAYGNLLVNPEVKVLLTSTHPEQTQQTAWVWHYGKSTILANLLGHDKIVYENPNFQKLILNGIRFLAQEKKDAFSGK